MASKAQARVRELEDVIGEALLGMELERKAYGGKMRDMKVGALTHGHEGGAGCGGSGAREQRPVLPSLMYTQEGGQNDCFTEVGAALTRAPGRHRLRSQTWHGCRASTAQIPTSRTPRSVCATRR